MAGIHDKVVAITGASSGIGEATAVLLAERGAKVVLAARRADRLEVLAAKIEAVGGQAAFVVTDVRRRQDLAELVAVAQKRFGRLDVLVSNAGLGAVAPLDEVAVDDWDDMIDVNIKGVLYGIAAALPGFRAQGSGHFVQTLSTSGLKIVPGQAVYAGTKNAVRAISEGLRQEAGDKLRVTTISPGMIRTDFATKNADPAIVAMAKKVAIAPEAIARAIAYAIEQPDDVDVNEIVVRPVAQA